MKESHSSWVRIPILVLLPILGILVVGAALLVGLRLGRASAPRLEPTPTTQPTSDANLAATTVTPTLGLTPTGEAPTDLPRPTATPQSTLSSEPTREPTPVRRPDNTPTVVPSHTMPLRVLNFAASPDPIQRGGTVTLSWDAPGAESVGITRLSPEGDIFVATEALALPARGSINLQVPSDYVESVKYYLGARDADGALAKAYVTVGIICAYGEFIAPRCPLSQDQIWAAYEPFEHGHMVWRSDTREIYVLYDGGTYETYTDTWQEGDPVVIPGSPPPGLYAPVRGFGNLYASQPGVRERLGWATTPEAGYTMWIETIHGGSGRYPGTSTYFTLPDNGVVNLYPFSSTWQRLP